MPKNPLIFSKTKIPVMKTPENQSAGILDDFAVRKVVSTREGTITKTPVNDNDIANKAYVDTHGGGGGLTNLDGGSAISVYGGTTAIDGGSA